MNLQRLLLYLAGITRREKKKIRNEKKTLMTLRGQREKIEAKKHTSDVLWAVAMATARAKARARRLAGLLFFPAPTCVGRGPNFELGTRTIWVPLTHAKHDAAVAKLQLEC